jgi:hypothetical protein
VDVQSGEYNSYLAYSCVNRKISNQLLAMSVVLSDHNEGIYTYLYMYMSVFIYVYIHVCTDKFTLNCTYMISDQLLAMSVVVSDHNEGIHTCIYIYMSLFTCICMYIRINLH